MTDIRPHSWFVAAAMLILALLLGYVLKAETLPPLVNPTTAQTYFRRVVAERKPGAFVMATASNTILTAEAQWKGHVITAARAYPLVKRGNVFLVEPMDGTAQVPPTPFISSSVAAAVIQNGNVRYGLFVTGRKVVVP